MLMVSHAIDPVRFNHAIAVTLTCNAVAVQQGCPAYEAVTPDEVYALFESFGWRCPITGIAHSDRTPLYLDWVLPIGYGRVGKNTLSNLRPVTVQNRPILHQIVIA